MDLQEFLTLEHQQLQRERHRLSANNNNNNTIVDTVENDAEIICPAVLLMQKANFVPAQCQRMASATSECNEPTPIAMSSLATNRAKPNSTPSTPRSHTVYACASAEADCAASVLSEELHLELGASCSDEENEQAYTLPTNLTKPLVNQQRQLLLGSARKYMSPNVSSRKLESGRPLSENRLPIRRSHGDDMEQWVTDTFYSYFPGFNNENQKRQNYLRERQRENQQNFLKHQMLNPPQPKYAINNSRRQQAGKHIKITTAATGTARSGNSTTSNTTTSNSTTDKTDLELIVNNNPNYVPPKTTTTYRQQTKLKPPGTARQQMLQDLGHVELSNIVTGDGIMERNMRSAELESARKKDYQRDLMQQIEEKRKAIEILREKERKQEEALTRRLEAQLKTIQLEEQLEKERMRAEKARIDSEHNRLMREQLLEKLEKDAQILKAKQTHKESNKPAAAATASNNNTADNNNNPGNDNNGNNNNKVYQYFSNSARHEYRRGQPLPAAVELGFEIPETIKVERECFHLCEKICPMCDEPLKSYESCCLRCQRKLALKMKQRKPKAKQDGNQTTETEPADVEYEQQDSEDENHYCHSSYALVCLKCERLYALCTTCLAKSDVCRACQRERNVCMNCRRTLCSFCLEEIACGRDAERTHINEQEDERLAKKESFRVLELNYASPEAQETQAVNPKSKHGQNSTSPPYSINIARNSVFHADYKPTPVKQTFQEEELPTYSNSANTSFEVDSADEQNLERVRRQTDQRLSRYLKNYGDLAVSKQRSISESRHRGTQTTPQSKGRRDVVLLEESTQNLSMPLLREMPKMTRRDTTLLAQSLAFNSQRKMDNLKKRWEVPAVQKFKVSTSSPKILTQVGAIRKQLQAARFFEDDVDDDDY